MLNFVSEGTPALRMGC